jgi:hypothetical protein
MLSYQVVSFLNLPGSLFPEYGSGLTAPNTAKSARLLRLDFLDKQHLAESS